MGGRIGKKILRGSWKRRKEEVRRGRETRVGKSEGEVERGR